MLLLLRKTKSSNQSWKAADHSFPPISFENVLRWGRTATEPRAHMQPCKSPAHSVPSTYLCDEIPFADLVTLLFLPARDGAHLHRRGQRRQCHLRGERQRHHPSSPDSGERSTGQGGTAGRAWLPSPGGARPPAGAEDRRARRYGMGLTKGAGGAAENGPKGAGGTAGGTGAQGTQAGRVEGLQLLRCNPERGEAAGSPGAGSSHLLVCRQAAAAARHEPRPAGRRQQLAGPSCRTAARSHGAPRRCPTDPGGAERSAAPRQPRGPRGYAPREHPPHAGAGAAAAAPTPLGDLLRPGAAPHGSHDAAALP